MPLPRAVPVTLTAAERTTLAKRARGAKTAHRDRVRAQIVLAAARGRDNARIAADLRVTVDTVRKWRGRFAGRGLDGLADLPRSGRPRRISELTRAAVVALACQLPAATGVPLSRWTGPELLAEVTRAGTADELSASSVLRILAEHRSSPGSTSPGSLPATRTSPRRRPQPDRIVPSASSPLPKPTPGHPNRSTSPTTGSAGNKSSADSPTSTTSPPYQRCYGKAGHPSESYFRAPQDIPPAPSASPASLLTKPSSIIARLRRVSWNRAVWLMFLRSPSSTIPSRARASFIMQITRKGASSFQQAQLAGARDRLAP
jgi:transposase